MNEAARALSDFEMGMGVYSISNGAWESKLNQPNTFEKKTHRRQQDEDRTKTIATDWFIVSSRSKANVVPYWCWRHRRREEEERKKESFEQREAWKEVWGRWSSFRRRFSID
jgi:hypothetical protein